MTPRLLDLFAGAGGCSAGYIAAGFDVTAVDLNVRALARNPASTHLEADAMAVLRGEVIDLSQFDVIRHEVGMLTGMRIPRDAVRLTGRRGVDTLELLGEWGPGDPRRSWIVENVEGAPLANALTLCGSMFDLRTWDHYIGQTVQLKRHRLFQSNRMLMAPGPCRHVKGMRVGGVYGGAWSKNRTLDPTVKRTGGYAPPDSVQRELMGIDWMTRQQLNQAIPPVYAEYLGLQLIVAAFERVA